MQDKLLKYKIGFAVIGIFAIAMAIFMGLQAGAVKNDAATFKQAEHTANELNQYINDNQVIPESLSEAHITDENVKYTKDSSKKYTFCVTYQTSGGGIDGTSLVDAVMYAGVDMQGYSSSDSDEYDASSLYLSSTHTKGENCQTVKPYLYDSSDSYYDSTLNAPDTDFAQLEAEIKKCNDDLSLSNDAYNDCIDKAYGIY